MTEFKLPELGENITEGAVTKILVKVGDHVQKGQSILEIETDKAVLEVPCAFEGVISEILIKSGAVVKVGQTILKIEDDKIASSPSAPRNDTMQKDAPRNDTQAHDVAPTGHSDTMTAASPASGVIPPTSLPERHDIPAAPSVRLLARELGIDLAQVPGSGLGGRISNGDVKAYCKMLNTSRGTGVASQPLPDFTKWGSVHREAMNNVRKKTAERLSHAWQNIPYVTQFDKADITQLEKLRKSISGTKTATPKKISVTPFIIKAVAAGLKKFPQFNSSIDITTQEIIFKDYINIGLAIDTDRGLLVPVLKNVDKMSLLQISDELAAMAQRARLRKITIEELQGGCFTISNLGGIGGTSFTPIINWPEVAILGVSRTLTEPVYIDGQFMPRPMLPLSLSYDHRVIDGADAARFVRWICEALQRWKDE